MRAHRRLSSARRAAIRRLRQLQASAVDAALHRAQRDLEGRPPPPRRRAPADRRARAARAGRRAASAGRGARAAPGPRARGCAAGLSSPAGTVSSTAGSSMRRELLLAPAAVVVDGMIAGHGADPGRRRRRPTHDTGPGSGTPSRRCPASGPPPRPRGRRSDRRFRTRGGCDASPARARPPRPPSGSARDEIRVRCRSTMTPHAVSDGPSQSGNARPAPASSTICADAAAFDPRARSVVESSALIKLNSQKHLRGIGADVVAAVAPGRRGAPRTSSSSPFSSAAWTGPRWAAAFRTANHLYLAGVVAITVVTYLLRAWRWGSLLDAAGARALRAISSRPRSWGS